MVVTSHFQGRETMLTFKSVLYTCTTGDNFIKITLETHISIQIYLLINPIDLKGNAPKPPSIHKNLQHRDQKRFNVVVHLSHTLNTFKLLK